MADNGTFDPFLQSLSFLAPDGVTQIPVPMEEVHSFQNIVAQSSIMFGIQLGVSFILILVLIMVTKSDKRRSIIFILNFLSLLLLFVHGVLMCVELTGPFYNFYSLVTGYYVRIGGAIRVSVAAEVLNFLAETTLELSMMFQVHVVCCTLSWFWRKVTMAASVLVVSVTTALRLVVMVINADYGIAHVLTVSDEQLARIDKWAAVHNIAFICSIYYFCGVFCAKLGYAILQRRKMCLKQFGPMQIIFIMGCQTLFVPATFGILAFFVLRASRIQILMYVVLAAFLPLSSLWATANTANAKSTSPDKLPNEHKFNAPLQDPGCSSLDSAKRCLVNKMTPNNDHSPASSKNGSSLLDSIDLEMQKMQP